jgi:hypothetical protein
MSVAKPTIIWRPLWAKEQPTTEKLGTAQDAPTLSLEIALRQKSLAPPGKLQVVVNMPQCTRRWDRSSSTVLNLLQSPRVRGAYLANGSLQVSMIVRTLRRSAHSFNIAGQTLTSRSMVSQDALAVATRIVRASPRLYRVGSLHHQSAMRCHHPTSLCAPILRTKPKPIPSDLDPI